MCTPSVYNQRLLAQLVVRRLVDQEQTARYTSVEVADVIPFEPLNPPLAASLD